MDSIPDTDKILKCRESGHDGMVIGCVDCWTLRDAELEALRGQQERVRGLAEKWRAGARAALIPGDLHRGFAKAEIVLADELDAALADVTRIKKEQIS